MVFGGPAVTPPCRSCPSPCWLSLVKCKPLLAVPCQVQTPCVALLSCHAPAPRSKQVVPYTLLLSVVEYKTLVLRGDMETAADVLETIPQASCSWLQGADVYRLSSCVSCQPLTYLVQESRNHVCRQPLAQLPVHTGPAIMCAASHWLSCWCTRALRSCVPPARCAQLLVHTGPAIMCAASPWRSTGGVLLAMLQDQHNSIAKFLEAKGMPEQALQVATDTGAPLLPDLVWLSCGTRGAARQALQVAPQPLAQHEAPPRLCVQQALAGWHAA